MDKLKLIAKCIVEILDGCGFDDVTDSSGFYIIKEFNDDTDRAVDVYKSTVGGNSHYVIYCSYEDEGFDYRYTDDLSVEQLERQLEDFYMASGGISMSKWAEIRNDFVCEDSHKIYIDAWLTDDDNEEGVVIARIDMDTKKIEYFDNDAIRDDYAQEVIKEAIDSIRYYKEN